MKEWKGQARRGQALVEFALVIPIFLLLVFGVIDVGRYVYVTNAFNQAAREGARFGSVEQWQYSCPSSVPVASQTRFTCTAAATLAVMAGAPSSIETPITVTCLSDANNPLSAVSSANCRPGYLLQVTVRTKSSPASQRYRFFTPVISQIVGSPVIEGKSAVVVQ